MILCLIILTVSVLMTALGIMLALKYDDLWNVDARWMIGVVLLIVFAITFIVTCVVTPISTVEANRDLDIFVHQKEYIENYEPASEYDTAAIANKKIELNEWLYEAQYTKEHYPICSFYGDEILELEPIK